MAWIRFGLARVSSSISILTSLTIIILLFGVSLPASADDIQEYRVKSAFIYNFLRYIRFETGFLTAEDRIEVCAWGDASVQSELGVVNGKSLEERTVWVHPVSGCETERCDVIFMQKNIDSSFVSQCQRGLNAKAVYVGESEDFLGSGGHFNFYLDDRKVRFEVSLGNLKRDKIDVSSRLLRIARVK